jgi:hypothetical protein
MPKTRNVCLLGTNDYDKVIQCLQISKGFLGESLSAIEYMDWESVAFSLTYMNLENPFKDTQYKFYLLVEVSGEECD